MGQGFGPAAELLLGAVNLKSNSMGQRSRRHARGARGRLLVEEREAPEEESLDGILQNVSRGGFVHADAQLRRVVERPGEPPWPVIGIWRFEGN